MSNKNYELTKWFGNIKKTKSEIAFEESEKKFGIWLENNLKIINDYEGLITCVMPLKSIIEKYKEWDVNVNKNYNGAYKRKDFKSHVTDWIGIDSYKKYKHNGVWYYTVWVHCIFVEKAIEEL